MRRNRYRRIGARKPSREELMKILADAIDARRDAGRITPEKAEELKRGLAKRQPA